MSSVLFSVRRRDLAWGVALIVLLSAIWVARSDIADAGGAPPGEGIAVVYVAVGTGFPDSLGVGPGAGANGAPIIIVPTSPPMDTATEAELERLDPRTVIIVGGTAVISTPMETAIGVLLPNAVVTRIAGGNRYQTNAMFSAATFPIEGWASIPAQAFTADQPATDDAVISYTALNATNGELMAPIQLPHGAEILELVAVGYDAHAVTDLTVTLFGIDDDGAAVTPAEVMTAGDTGWQTVSDTTIASGAIVDNETYTYVVLVTDALGVTGPGNLFIRKVKVRYRLGVSTG